NTATAFGNFQGTMVSDDDPGSYSVTGAPAIHLEKLVNGQADTEGNGPVVLAGSTVTYTYNVSNTGNVPLSNIQVSDVPTPDSGSPTPVLSGGFNVGDINQDNILDLTETWTYTATSTAQVGQHDNLATASGDSQGMTVSDDDPGS